MTVAVDFHRSINVIQISAGGDSVFIRRADAHTFLAQFMRALSDSAPSDHSSQPASGDPARPVGTDYGVSAREGAENLYRLDSRRHSVHVDRYACDPDETGGAA